MSQAKDKVDARIGLTSLILGFGVAGARLCAAEDSTRRASTDAALVAFGLAVAAALVVVGVWRVARGPLLRRILVRIARVNYLARPPETKDRPYAFLLVMFAEELGYRRSQGESPEAFARRVFRIERVLAVGQRPTA